MQRYAFILKQQRKCTAILRFVAFFPLLGAASKRAENDASLTDR